MRTFPYDGRGSLSPFRRMGGTFLFLVVALWLCNAAFAQFISSDELFLAPLDVPTQVYDGIPLAVGDSFNFSAANVPGATQLLGVHILPLLNPNPTTTEGEYSDSDLAGISLNNYSSYFNAQPNVNYSATLISNETTTVNFGQEGQYYVQLVTSDGTATTNTVFRADVDDFLLEIPSLGLRDQTGPNRVIVCPTSDCTLISNPNRVDNALNQAKKAVPGATLVNNIAAVKAALAAKFKANGNKKFSLTIIAHGAPGLVEIGSDILGVGGKMTAAQFQRLIDPYVSSISFFSCSVGAGAAGTKFGKDLASSIKGGVTLFDKTVTINAKIWDIDAKGKAQKFELTAAAPEPAVLALLLPAILALGLLRVRGRVLFQRGAAMRTCLWDGRGRSLWLRALSGTLVFLAVLLPLCGSVRAQYIGSDELFLAPLEVPTQVYDGIPLTAGDSFTFSAGNVPGATQLLGVHILPLLNPNPTTTEGEYSPSDLANVTLSNYSSYYYEKPNVDYNATIITNDATTVTFSQEGQYYVQLVTSDGMTTANTVFRADVDDYLLEIPSLGLRDQTGPNRVLPCPASDLIVISDVPRQDNAIDQAKKQLPGAAKAANIAALKKAITDKFKANKNKKFSLTIIAHGAPGQVEIGNQILGQPGAMSAADFQKMIDPYVKSVRFFSCSVGAGAKGDQFGKDLGASIKGGVTLYDKPVTVAGKIWDIDAQGKGKSFQLVPEPGPITVTVAFFGGLGITLLRARRRK